MTNQPLISIITVVYNGKAFLEQTIQSVISQSYKNIEYIIIDGGSTDGTVDIVKKYEDNIDYWISEKDDGIYDAMNKGIFKASGEFTAFINADDWYKEDVLTKIAKQIEQNSDVDFFYGDLNFIKEDGEIVLWKGNRGFKGLEIPHPTIFIRTKVLKNNLFSMDFKIVSDAELTLKLFHRGIKSYYIDEVIANFRDGGVSSSFWVTQKENFIILSRYIGFTYAVKSFFKKSLFALTNYIKGVIN